MKIKNTITGDILAFTPEYARIRRMQRRVFAWANFVDPYIKQAGRSTRLVMITLTYNTNGGFTWKANDIKVFMKRAKEILKDNLIACAQVGELQTRGEVHYHVLLVVKSGTRIPKPDTSGWWNKGMSKIETARSVFYIASYVGKKYQKVGVFPKGMRMFSVYVNKRYFTELERWYFRLSALPVWLKNNILIGLEYFSGKKVKREKGGGWSCGDVLFMSPWIVVSYE